MPGEPMLRHLVPDNDLPYPHYPGPSLTYLTDHVVSLHGPLATITMALRGQHPLQP